MAELAGFIIIITITGVCAAVYGIYRLVRKYLAYRSRWYVFVEDGSDRHRVGVYVDKKGGYSSRICIGEMEASVGDFQERLDALIEKADATCAAMNANRELNKVNR